MECSLYTMKGMLDINIAFFKKNPFVYMYMRACLPEYMNLVYHLHVVYLGARGGRHVPWDELQTVVSCYVGAGN